MRWVVSNCGSVVCALALLFVALPASAQDCSTLSQPVFVPATTDVKPYLTRLAARLASPDAGVDRMTIVYQGAGSCTAAGYVTGSTALQGTGIYWTNETDGGVVEERTCTFPSNAQADLALSDVTLSTCTGSATTAGVGQFSSVVQPFGFVVPPASDQQAITAEEAYFLFKFGGQTGSQVPPWTDPALIAIRTPAATVSLFTTRGSLEGVLFPVPPSTSSLQLKWTAPEDAGPVHLHAVLRDDRGGISWASLTFDLR